MALFHLQIVTPDKLVYDGQAEKLIVRAVTGDVCIMARHIDYAVPVAVGVATVQDDRGNMRRAACNSGFLSVSNGEARLLPLTFEWADEIDVERAKIAKAKAEADLSAAVNDDVAYRIAEAKLNRALTRLKAGEN